MVVTREQLLEAAAELEKQANSTPNRRNRCTFLATAEYLRADAAKLPINPTINKEKHHEG